VAVALGRAMARADAIHVRCPGSYGLLGAALAPRFSRRVIAKYAGQWNGYAGERWPARVERALLRSRWWHGPVTVYGQWPGEPPHIVPFFTSMMSGAQVEHAAAAAARRQWHRPLRVLFCGLLEPRKRADALIEAVAIAGRRGLSTEVAIVGGGAERGTLEQQAHDAGVAHAVRFVGALPFERALEWYEWADCLVLPSQHSEGWPKVVAEAMAYGVLCIAVRHGQLASMLTGRGLLLESGAPPEIAAALARVEAEPAACREMADAASAWARQYSLEGLRDAIAALLIDRWQLPRSDTPQEMEAPA
jgi:glycosyltransferase involved in cell wall biosynthesis